MKAREIIITENSDLLNEINMSPGNLKKLVQNISATAGMEFEMIVPGTYIDSGDIEPEIDFDADRRSRNFSDITDFFLDNEFNSRRDVNRLIADMNNEFLEWLDEEFSKEWNKEAEDKIYDYLVNNQKPEVILKILGLDPEDTDGITKDQIKEAAAIIAEDKVEPYYEEAEEEARNDFYEEADESEWLREEYPYMSDIMNHFSINWPYYTEQESDNRETDIGQVVDNFKSAIGRPVVFSQSYHGATRKPDQYVIEPDSSIKPDDGDSEQGLEFVSPPLPMNEMIADFLKVKQWAKDNNCSTNKSTGLHINVSLENYDFGRLDYVKLAVLLGDQYVLNEFGRQYNTFCRSALGKIRERVKEYPARAQELLDEIKKTTAGIASKIIHSGVTDKYTSINNKTGYIEFRSAGGDWLEANTDKIINTLYRYVVALDAACDPEKYKQEYLKKLYTILKPANTQDPVYYYNQYQAGQITKTELKNFINALRAKRISPPTSGEKRWNWDIRLGGTSSGISVVARTEDEAAEKALTHWSLPPSYRIKLDIRAVGPYEGDV